MYYLLGCFPPLISHFTVLGYPAAVDAGQDPVENNGLVMLCIVVPFTLEQFFLLSAIGICSSLTHSGGDSDGRHKTTAYSSTARFRRKNSIFLFICRALSRRGFTLKRNAFIAKEHTEDTMGILQNYHSGQPIFALRWTGSQRGDIECVK